MKLNEAFPGKTWKRDCAEFENGGGVVLEIAHCAVEQMDDGQKKLGVHFTGEERRLICNKTNFQNIAIITGEDDSDNWPGHKIELFNDPMVTGPAGQRGGVRVRAPKGAEAKKGELADDDNIPF
jgi:hypothetical protein